MEHISLSPALSNKARELPTPVDYSCYETVFEPETPLIQGKDLELLRTIVDEMVSRGVITIPVQIKEFDEDLQKVYNEAVINLLQRNKVVDAVVNPVLTEHYGKQEH